MWCVKMGEPKIYVSKMVRVRKELEEKISKMSAKYGVSDYVIRNLALYLGLKQLDNLVKSKNLTSEDIKRLLKSVLLLGD